ncbi:hypothetical protein NDU88_006511 [Pleurodeles waltl]|uniref:Uncharacterized protein n=1 Tax=Pleurodeles waltl TaxID=8319 RepID=A0AAV7MZG8_PLEWA|nr:hypothetical protein NDU88_006511 [Pleurodeles waltl]
MLSQLPHFLKNEPARGRGQQYGLIVASSASSGLTNIITRNLSLQDPNARSPKASETVSCLGHLQMPYWVPTCCERWRSGPEERIMPELTSCGGGRELGHGYLRGPCRRDDRVRFWMPDLPVASCGGLLSVLGSPEGWSVLWGSGGLATGGGLGASSLIPPWDLRFAGDPPAVGSLFAGPEVLAGGVVSWIVDASLPPLNRQPEALLVRLLRSLRSQGWIYGLQQPGCPSFSSP